jgi:twitching motility protein PilT
LIESILPEEVSARLGQGKNFDCSIALRHGDRPCRFRANVFLAQGDWCGCLRHVPDAIPSFEWMGFPETLAQRLIGHTNGLVIITGVTGSGKSTTLAALINLLNRRGNCRVITVEEPIEYLHPRISSSVITQREVGRDVDSFFDGLKYGLRQDPDVILLGEIRDRDTAQMALSAAETGHLILTTLHTKDAKGAVTRFVDLFPYDAQEDVRTQLALSLRSVVSQHLLPSARPGEKRCLALEVLHVNQPVRAAIKFGKIDSIESAIQTGKRDGMATLDEDLQRLVDVGRISLETARKFAKESDGITPPGMHSPQ